jgi:hypothetical protein
MPADSQTPQSLMRADLRTLGLASIGGALVLRFLRRRALSPLEPQAIALGSAGSPYSSCCCLLWQPLPSTRPSDIGPLCSCLFLYLPVSA